MNEPARDLQALAQRSVAVDLASLLRAKETARANMERNNSAKTIAAFNAAVRALEAAMRKTEQEHHKPQGEPAPADLGFATLEAVRRFLDEQGYAVTKSTIDRHKKAGKIKPGPGYVYTRAAALKYAGDFLKEKETGLKKSEGAVLRQSQLVDARTDLLTEQTLLARRKREVEEGKWVLKSSVAQDLAARAVMLKTGFKQLAASSVSDWVHLVNGDPLRIPELLRLVLEGMERVLDDYARADGVVLVFNGPEEEVEEVAMETGTEEAGS